MSIIERTTTILRANINALLDQAEDPEKALDQILRDMSSAIAEGRGQVADMIAQQKVLEANVERNQTLAGEWRQKATLAVQSGKDDLAREALRRQNDYLENAKVYEEQLAAQSQLVQKLKTELGQIESKYEDAKRNRETLIARHRRAETTQRITQVSGQLNMMDPTTELGRWEERVQLEEARAEAQQEVQAGGFEDQFEALESGPDVERQLQELKAQLGAGEKTQALPGGGS